MKTNTHIAIVLDRSGSMAALKNEIIGGFNSFLADQRAVPGEATITLVQFDNEIDRLANFVPLANMADLTDKTYVPRGMTRLYDAIGLTVKGCKEEIDKMEKKPDKVLVAIMTDGLENSSVEYDTKQISDLLSLMQASGWEFTFMGANQDAILTGRSIGLHKAAANITYGATGQGVNSVMHSFSEATAKFRCSTGGYSYEKKDRDAQSIDPSVAAQTTGTSIRTESGHAAGKVGGPARAESLTKKERSQSASHAAKARWSRKSV